MTTDLVLDQPLRPLMELVAVSLVVRGTVAIDRVGCGFDATSITGVIGLDPDDNERPTGRAALRDLVTGHALPNSGTLRFGGLRIDRLGPSARVRLGILAMRRRQLLTTGSVRDMLLAARLLVSRPTLRLVLDSGARSSEEDARDIDAILDFVEIDGLAERPVASLGGLEARLAELARCLAQRPRLLLLEHPFARLGAADREQLARLLVRLRKAALAIVVIDDDLATLGRVADRCLVFDRGRLIADATPAAIGASSRVYRLLTGSEL